MNYRFTAHIINGVIIAGILILLNLAGMFTGLQHINWFAFVPSMILVLLGFVNVLIYGKQTGNRQFGNLFAFGFKTIAVTTCIMFLYTLLSIHFFFPKIKQEAYQQTKAYVEKQANILPDNVDAETQKAMKAYMPTTLSLVVITTLVVGAVGTAGGALATSKISIPNH